VSQEALSALRAQLAAQLDEAHRARRGVPPALEAHVRAYAHAQRVASVPIERVLVDVKALVSERMAADTPVFIPRVVGWTVAGYFDGATRPASEKNG
jgi:hypothetical protein